MDMIVDILVQGMIYAILALGVLITYRILDFPDLTVDSAFPLGAAISAVLTAGGMHPALTLPIALAGGALAGLCTGLIHVKCGVRDLLSGIITMTGLYSINLYIAGKANVPLFGTDTLFTNGWVRGLPRGFQAYATLAIVLAILLAAKLLLDWFLKTRRGLLLRAVGDNATVVTTLARDSGGVKILGLTLANALVALSGAVMCQQQRSFEISMGTGAIVTGLASVIIGVNVFKHASFVKATTAVVIGSIAYKACVAIAISLGLSPKAMKLVTAVLFLIILVASQGFKKRVKRHA